jgi:hypothetical protein
MIDCLITFITFIIITIKSVVYHFLFRPPNPPSKYSKLILVYKVTLGKEDEPEVKSI